MMLVFLALLSLIPFDGLADKCSTDLSMKDLDGEVIIAGLFPLNYYSSKKSTFVRNDVAITWVEAFIFAIGQINNNSEILPGMRIGYDVRNSCNEEEIALKNVLDFRLDLSFLDNSTDEVDDTRQKCGCLEARNRIVAVVGGASSSISTSVSNVLSVDGMPQISYSSTSVALSNKDKYPNFLRTLPSDIYQAKAIVALLKKFEWTYVNIFASDDDYGRLGFYQLEKELRSEGMCIAESKIFKRSLNRERLNEIVIKLRKGVSKNANVVVLWCQINAAKMIIEEAWKLGLRGITWLGCETLGNNVDLLELGHIVNGFIGLKPTLSNVTAFEEYLDNLVPSNESSNNPWLQAYWSALPACSSEYLENTTINCTLLREGKSLPRSKYSHVISAVYAVSLALHDVARKSNGTVLETLSVMTPEEFYNEIKGVKYRDAESDLNIGFDDEGDPEFASYTFTNIQISQNRIIDFVDIGQWDGEIGKIEIKVDRISWAGNQTFVSSKCSTPCLPGMIKIQGDVSCCWSCVECNVDTISIGGNVTSCVPCPDSKISNANNTECLQLKEITFSASNMMLEAFLFIASVTLLSVVFVFLVYIKNWNTPVVKSSNRELSIIQLVMLFASFWYPASYVMKPSRINCTIQPVWLAICPTIVLAITFAKTYRLYRIFNKKTTEQSKMLHNKYQSLVVFIILFLQILFIVLWLQRNKLKVVKTINRVEMSFIWHCCENAGNLHVISQSYNITISIACAFMAFRARKLPTAFNEARYIAFGTFTYCILWMFSIPLFLSVDVIEKNQAICAVSIITSLSFLLCFYGNKIRVMLFVPGQNTKHFFTRQATIDQFARSNRDSSSMTSSWPTLPNTHGTAWSLYSSSYSIDQRTSTVGSLSSLVSAKKLAGTCNPRIMKKYAPSPKDILFPRYGRERSQTVD